MIETFTVRTDEDFHRDGSDRFYAYGDRDLGNHVPIPQAVPEKDGFQFQVVSFLGVELAIAKGLVVAVFDGTSWHDLDADLAGYDAEDEEPVDPEIRRAALDTKPNHDINEAKNPASRERIDLMDRLEKGKPAKKEDVVEKKMPRTWRQRFYDWVRSFTLDEPPGS